MHQKCPIFLDLRTHPPRMMLPIIFAIMAAVSSATMNSSTLDTSCKVDDEAIAIYGSWRVKYRKSYKSLEEMEARFYTFKENLQYIQLRNSQQHSFKLEVNKFADLSINEFRVIYTGSETISLNKKLKNLESTSGVLKVPPNGFDWRTKGAVAAVKDQQETCGAGWAFSTIGSAEGINQTVTGDGGSMDYAFHHIVKNGGIGTDNDYPYRHGKCHPSMETTKAAVSIDGYEQVPVNDELSLQNAVANQPITVAIKAGSRDFQFYTSGIFTGECGTDLDHGVVVVGYGTDSGKDYWILRNSWGAEWGEEGYMRLETGKCGIAMEPSYPTVQNPPNPAGPSPVIPLTLQQFKGESEPPSDLHACSKLVTILAIDGGGVRGITA